MNKAAVSIISVILSASIAGGGVFYFENTKLEDVRTRKDKKIGRLEKELSAEKKTSSDLKKENEKLTDDNEKLTSALKAVFDDGSSDTENTNNVSQTPTIEVLTNRTDLLEDGSLEKMTEEFENEHNCKVKYTAYLDYNGDASKRMAASKYGDVLAIIDDVKTQDLSNFFEPLGTVDELSKKYKWVSKKSDEDGNVYGLACGGSVSGIVYNKAVWEKAGIKTLPKTPDEFIKDLNTIADKTDAIPYYTNYKDASWTLPQWQNLVVSASGRPDYEKDLAEGKEELFDKNGGCYPVYKLMFDIFSDDKLTEEDHMGTEWESSKTWLGEGKIATMVMGSWAVGMLEKAADNPDDIGYMPVPITAKDGKQYAQTDADYCYGVNKNSENKELAKEFVEWFVTDSGFNEFDGLIPTSVNGELPDSLSEFDGAVLFEKEKTPEEFDDVDRRSNVIIWGGDTDNFKIKIAEAAFKKKGEAEFEKIIKEENKKWKEAVKK